MNLKAKPGVPNMRGSDSELLVREKFKILAKRLNEIENRLDRIEKQGRTSSVGPAENFGYRWVHEFRFFLEYIKKWCVAHDKVSGFDIGIGYDEFTIIIVTKSEDGDLDLEDQITDLDIELAKKFHNCPAMLYQSPFELLEEEFQCQIRL